jgi:glycosyltransferase involved in cell wall biosynthesis
MRLNWFSPLPPQRTDIAHYTARIAAALAERFEVTFWTHQPADSAFLPPGAMLRRYRPGDVGDAVFRRSVFAGLNVYNLGNDARFHAAIADVALAVPGLVILHDTRLHHFVFERSRADEPPFASYLALARETYGPEGEATARRIAESEGRLIDAHVEAMPFVEPFLAAAVGAVCHSSAAAAEVRQRSDAPLLTLPLPFASLAPPAPSGRAWAPPWRFVMYGYINANRRLEEILRALADWPEAPDFHLDVYGVLWDEAGVRQLVERSGLAGRVRLHGYAPEAPLDAAIADAHLAFNLRHPTMGEASGGILRAWAVATPALVTNAGWYAGLPDAAAWKISVEAEAADIRRAVLELARHPARFSAMGVAAQARLQALHAPSRYAGALRAALADRPRLMAHFAARRLGRRARDHAAAPAEWSGERGRVTRLADALFGIGLSGTAGAET